MIASRCCSDHKHAIKTMVMVPKVFVRMLPVKVNVKIIPQPGTCMQLIHNTQVYTTPLAQHTLCTNNNRSSNMD